MCNDGATAYKGFCETAEAMGDYKEHCEITGGSWSEETLTCFCEPNKNLQNPDQVDFYCECTNKTEYELDYLNPTNGCILKDPIAQKAACDKADGATWVPDEDSTDTDPSGTCVCDNVDYYWQWNTDTQTGRCKTYPGYENCISAENTSWDNELHECDCTISGQVFDGTKCVDTQETKNINANIAASEIANTILVLDRIKRELDKTKSKWVNAEGKFNTARLASDATAGIVLGTTSALITSKLVKKHQVQDGFEDIHCTIGGQTVADWGDEFTIGMQ